MCFSLKFDRRVVYRIWPGTFLKKTLKYVPGAQRRATELRVTVEEEPFHGAAGK